MPLPFRANTIPIWSEQLQDENQDMIDPKKWVTLRELRASRLITGTIGLRFPRVAKHSSGPVGYTCSAGSAIPEDIPLPLTSRSSFRNVSRSTSAMASKIPPPKQQFPPSTVTSSTQTPDQDEDVDRTNFYGFTCSHPSTTTTQSLYEGPLRGDDDEHGGRAIKWRVFSILTHSYMLTN